MNDNNEYIIFFLNNNIINYLINHLKEIILNKNIEYLEPLIYCIRASTSEFLLFPLNIQEELINFYNYIFNNFEEFNLFIKHIITSCILILNINNNFYNLFLN